MTPHLLVLTPGKQGFREYLLQSTSSTTGFGRAGSFTVTSRLGLTPDMLVLSKGITAGYVPLAAIAVTSAIAQAATSAETVFHHGSTADGHPLAMAAANAVLDELLDDGLLSKVQDRGAELATAIREHSGSNSAITRVHGRGLMIAVHLAHASGAAMSADDMNRIKVACRDRGLLVSVCGSMVLLTPPLVVTSEETVVIATRLGAAIADVTAGDVSREPEMADAH